MIDTDTRALVSSIDELERILAAPKETYQTFNRPALTIANLEQRRARNSKRVEQIS